MQHRIKKISRTIAGEGPARAVRAMRSRSKAKGQHTCMRIAEGRNRPTPVLLVDIGTPSHPRHFSAMIAQPGAALACNNACVESLKVACSFCHEKILGHRATACLVHPNLQEL